MPDRTRDWLPVVWMQARMRKLAATAAAEGRPLPAAYHVLFRWWFAFGFPAFASVAAIFWPMIARPPESGDTGSRGLPDDRCSGVLAR
jgi:uncharacterized membrane protein